MGSERRPPWVPYVVLLLIAPKHREEVVGDLCEEYHQPTARRYGALWAHFWFWAHILRTIIASRWHGRARWVSGSGPHLTSSPRRGRKRLMFDWLTQDLRFLGRSLRRSPGFAGVAVLTIALGIGVNVTVFSLINATLLSPPPHVADPDRLVLVYHDYETQPMLIPYPTFRQYRERNRVFSGMAVWDEISIHLRAGDATLRVGGALVSGEYFATLGVEMIRGRPLQARDDEVQGGHPVAVISHSLWQRTFGGADDIVGDRLALNGAPFEVIGVAPPGFRGVAVGDSTDVWVPMAMLAQVTHDTRDRLSDPRSGWSFTLARLRPDVTMQRAEQRMSLLAGQIPEETIGGDSILLFDNFWVGPYLRGDLVDFNRRLAAIVGVVLLLACANVANLLLTQATGRRAEVAVRFALGATRSRLIRQHMTEGLVLSLLGGAAGLAFASVGGRLLAFARLRPDLALADTNLGIDRRVLAAAFLLSVFSGVLFTVLPALRASVTGPISRLATARRGERTGRWVQSGLVVAQVALSLVVLVCAGLLMGTMSAIGDIHPGFDAEAIAALVVDLELEGYDEGRGRERYQRIVNGLERLPNVVSASVADAVPFTPVSYLRSSGATFVSLEDGSVPDGVPSSSADPSGQILVGLTHVAPEYFETMGIPIRSGRSIDATDQADGRNVVVVSERMAGAMWPGTNPIGRLLRLRRPAEVVEVVGVVGDVKTGNLTRQTPVMYLYRPLAQSYRPWLTFVARASGDADRLLPEMLGVIRDADPDIAVYGLGTMSDRVEQSLWSRRLTTTLVSGFGALALVLAAMGLYALLAHAVAQRGHELGVRVALGANRKEVLSIVFRRGIGLVAVGIVLGLPTAWAATRLFEGTIYGISPLDPFVHVTNVAVMLLVAAVACCLPAWRAARVDPLVALRNE